MTTFFEVQQAYSLEVGVTAVMKEYEQVLSSERFNHDLLPQ